MTETEYEYDVYGNYEGQEDGDHWATFATMAEAERYRAIMVAEAERHGRKLYLGVARKKKEQR